MHTNGKSENENIYFRCRKDAAVSNERLNSRELAADLLGISPSALTKHELGITKNVPVDIVVMMSELYGKPELKNWYCRNECPIGKELPVATNCGEIQSIAVKVLNSLDRQEIDDLKSDLLKIAEDGKVTEDEAVRLKEIQLLLEKLALLSSELKIFTKKNGGV